MEVASKEDEITQGWFMLEQEVEVGAANNYKCCLSREYNLNRK